MVVVLGVSMCVCVSVSVTVLPAIYLVFMSKVQCFEVPYSVTNIQIVWNLLKAICSPVLASFAYNCYLLCSLISS